MPPPGFRQMPEDAAAKVRGDWSNQPMPLYYRATQATGAYRLQEMRLPIDRALIVGAISGAAPAVLAVLVGPIAAGAAWALILILLVVRFLTQRSLVDRLRGEAARIHQEGFQDIIDLGPPEERAQLARAEEPEPVTVNTGAST